MTRLADRLQVPRHCDGLSGRTEAERREIAGRIEAASRAKGAVEGRTLTPREVALAVTPQAAGAATRKCTACGSILPETREYFYRPYCARLGRPAWESRCIPCRCRDVARWRRSEGGKASEARRADKVRESGREYMRRLAAARKAAGLTAYPPRTTARQRLICSRNETRGRLRKATDPAKIERLKARIADLTREIDRMGGRHGGVIP